MTFSTGKTARAIRRRELLDTLLTSIEQTQAQPETKSSLRKDIIELYELSVIEANIPAKPRRRK